MTTEKPEQNCYFCRKLIHEDEDGVTCAYCAMPAHKKELNAWIKRFGTCPRCQRELKLWVD